MSAAAIPFTPRPSVPFLTVRATTKRPHSAVSAQLRTTGRYDDGFNQKQNVGAIGRAVLTSSSNPKLQPPTAKPNLKEPAQQQLTGSVVLAALSRATAEKAKKKKKKKKNNFSTSSPRIVREGKVINEMGMNKVVDVKPLCVKEEWGIRLQELQDRLDELKIIIM